MREDIPVDKVGSKGRRVKGVKYLLSDSAERMDMKPIYAIIKEALADARSKKKGE